MAEETKPAEEQEQSNPEKAEQGSLPAEEKTGDAPPKVDDGEVGTSKGKQDFAFAQLRRERKEALDRIEKLEQDAETISKEHKQTLASFGIADPSQSVVPGTEPQTLDAKGVESIVTDSLDKRKVADAQEDAYTYVLSQDDVQKKEHVAEIKDVMHRYSLDKLAEIDPHSATELGLEKWRNERNAKESGEQSTKEEQAGGVPSGPARGGSGKPKMTVEAIVALSDAEFEKQKSELWKAAKS